MTESQRMQQEINVVAAQRSAANAIEQVRGGTAHPDLLYSLVASRPVHERRAFMRELQKALERSL